MKKTNAILLLILAVLLAGCSTAAPQETPPVTQPPAVVAAFYLDSLPGVWDHTAEQTPEVAFLRELTCSSLYEFSADGSGIIPQQASALPVDVTAEYLEGWNIPAEALRGYAFRIDLNPLACWDDGTAITADDWVTALAEDSGRFAMSEITGETVVSLAEAGYGSVSEAREAGITEFYLDVEHFWGLNQGWRKVSDRERFRDDAMPGSVNESFVSAAYLFDTYLEENPDYAWMQSEFVGICTDETESILGILKTGDAQITLILNQPMTVESLAAYLADCRLTTAAGRSCGPWRVLSQSADLIELEPNPSFWGEYTYTADILKIRAS